MTARPEEEVAKWRAEHEIKVVGQNIPKPVTTFAHSPFPGKCCQVVCAPAHMVTFAPPTLRLRPEVSGGCWI